MKKQKEIKPNYPKARTLFLIIRGEKSEHHNAPYSPIILCTRTHTAKWESRGTENGATVFENFYPHEGVGNWILCRYKGYDVSSNSNFTLFDGKTSHEVSNKEELEKLFPQAVWWSYDEMPKWVADLGCKYPEDDWTRKMISEDMGGCLLPHSKEMKLRDTLEKYDEPHWLKTE